MGTRLHKNTHKKTTKENDYRRNSKSIHWSNDKLLITESWLDETVTEHFENNYKYLLILPNRDTYDDSSVRTS